jgi:hypothetical protein
MRIRHLTVSAALPGALCVPAHTDGDARDISRETLADRAVARGAGAGRIA